MFVKKIIMRMGNLFLMKKIRGMKIISQFIAFDHRRHDGWRRQISWGEIRRRTDEGISESLKRNGIATGHVQSYLWSIATDFVGPPIPFRPFNAFASLAFLDSVRYSIVYRMVKTSLNLFRTLFRSSSLSIAFQIENRSVVGNKSQTIFSVNVASLQTDRIG